MPKVGLPKLQLGITRNNRSSVRPVASVWNQTCPYRIVGDVMHQGLVSFGMALLGTQQMIVRLRLPLVSGFRQHIAAVTPEKADEGALVPFTAPAMQQKMNVIRHQTVNWAGDLISATTVKQQPAEPSCKARLQPTRTPIPNGQGPMHNGFAPVGRIRQPRQMTRLRFMRGHDNHEKNSTFIIWQARPNPRRRVCQNAATASPTTGTLASAPTPRPNA